MAVHTEQVLESATRTLASNPGATLAEVAAAAGVSRTTIFARYPTRAALLEAVALDGIAHLESAYQTAGAGTSTAPAIEVLTGLVAQLIPLGPRIAFLFRERSLDDNPAVQSRLMSLQATDINLLQRAQTEGLLSRDIPITWLARSLDALVFAAWEGVHAGDLAPRDAPTLVITTFLHGTHNPS
jgi:AcrR family transcriptional regulator